MQQRDLMAGIIGMGVNAPSLRGACGDQTTRRNILALSALFASGLAFGTTRTLADPADERPKEGDKRRTSSGPRR
jgi:hypothetical protein